MRKSLLLVLLVAVITVLSGTLCLADAPDSSYIMVLNDEFDGTNLNTDIWAYRTGEPYGGKNLQENVRVSDGKLYLDYRKVDGFYTGGGVLTLANLPYGYYETKAKTYTGANGFHTSFWTAAGNSSMSHKPERLPQDGSLIEIDGFEFNSNQTTTAPKPAYNLHYWWGNHVSSGGSYYECDTDGDSSTADWFTMGFEWLPGKIIFYCNGQKVGEENPTLYNPSSLWLTAVAMPDNYKNSDGTYNIDDTKMDANGYFGSSEYEYFRFYNKKLKGVNLLGNGHFEFNRHDKHKYPRGFYVTGLVNPAATPLSHSGFYSMHMFKGSTMGQELQYIAPGKYTFEGYFRTKNATARLAVYDKKGTLLKAINIPQATEWTKVSLTDVNVSDSAYAVVEVTDGEVLADDLSFFCQEGEEGHESYRDTDYETYGVFKTAESQAETIDISGATKSDHEWSSSSVTGISNLYTNASWRNYSNINATLSTTIKKDGKYEVQLYRIQHENNTAKQDYTVSLDGVVIAENISVATRDGSTTAGDWIKLCDIDAKAGQVLQVKLTIPKISLFSDNDGNARITPVKVLSYDQKFADTVLVTQFSNPVFQHANIPYVFDETETSLYPYKRNNEIYIPYQAIKSKITIPGVDASAKYVTATQVNASDAYRLIKQGSYVIIYSAIYEPSQDAINNVITAFSNFKNSFFYSTDKTAEFLGTAAASYQELFDRDSATYTGNWGTSTLGYNGKSYYAGSASATANWELSPKYSNRYSIEFYSIVHAGNSSSGATPSTTSAGVELSLLGKTYSYKFDQCNGQQGWYSLGEFDLEADDTLFIDLYNAAGSGILRANAVRLVPVFETASFAGTEDKANQEYYAHTDAVKTGTWTDGTGSYKDCTQAVFSEENKNASVKWSVSPKDSTAYFVQLYSPQFGTSATKGAKVVLKANDDTSYFLFNQSSASGAGWYNLGMLDLTEQDKIEIEISNFAGENNLYAKAIRLIPVFEIPAFVNDRDMLGQEYYSHTVATKVGSWQNSGGEYSGCCTAPNGGDNTDASITWNVTPAKNTKYSIQVYVPKYTNAGAKDATVTLNVNGSEKLFSVYQRADSPENTGNGWYDLGTYSLTTLSNVSISITNRTEEGWLRAKAIRLVPVTDLKFATEQDVLINRYYGPDSAEKVGEWIYSGASYAGCVYSGNTYASITWNAIADTDNTYDIQIFIPRYTSAATSAAELTLDINGKTASFEIDQRMESEENTGTGWYSLGSYALKTTDLVSLTLKNKALDGHLRAKGIRLIPTNITPAFVGLSNEANQELYDYSKGIRTGTWLSSSAVLGTTSYYGGGTHAYITWTPVPKKSQKYSIQVYMPHHTSGSTREAYVTITIDGLSHTFTGINQNSDPADGTGWYDFGVFDLTPSSVVTVTLGKNTGTYVRAKDMRLVPYPGSVSVTKSGSTVTATLGTMCNYAKTVVFAEFDGEGNKVATQILDAEPTLTITMQNSDNNYKLFYWKNLQSMVPVLAPFSSEQ